MTLEYREIRSSIPCFEMASFVNVMSPTVFITYGNYNDVFNLDIVIGRFYTSGRIIRLDQLGGQHL